MRTPKNHAQAGRRQAAVVVNSNSAAAVVAGKIGLPPSGNLVEVRLLDQSNAEKKHVPVTARSKDKLTSNPYPLWAPRFWHGMLTGPWFRLLLRNGLRIHPLCLPLASTISASSFVNTLCRPLQQLILGNRLAKTQVKDAPIFIIGHWRSGTTLLHELMVLDGRYTFPTTYECFAPNHFLITAWLIARMRFLIPSQRPMDNMITGWDRPQEDEFALCNMGIPSPYLTMVFPNEPPQYSEYFDLEGLSSEDRKRWQEALVWFLQRVTFRDPKRIILKSPPHLARIKALLEIFPDARFVHIVRDPYPLYGSTVKLWKSLYRYQALQRPKFAGLEEYVFSCFERMYTAFDAQRHLIDPARLYEVRYEDLVRDQLGEMRKLYDHLNLGEFQGVEPRIREYIAGTKDYQANKYEIDPQLRSEIDRRWGPFMRRYGYCQEAPAARESA
jgi:omega-hydroxy-beta-dihydromenaquinone-9 sulfotransferase